MAVLGVHSYECGELQLETSEQEGWKFSRMKVVVSSGSLFVAVLSSGKLDMAS